VAAGESKLLHFVVCKMLRKWIDAAVEVKQLSKHIVAVILAAWVASFPYNSKG
jgi:hypothetical protein